MSDEYYTPSHELDLVRSFLGQIDLDPASSREANELVGATTYYTIADDGLAPPWFGKVFCNPPYSRGLIEPFVLKFLRERDNIEGILLVNANTSSSWCQALLRSCDAACLCGSRIKFVGGASSARASSAYFYVGPRAADFCSHFAARGYTFKNP